MGRDPIQHTTEAMRVGGTGLKSYSRVIRARLDISQTPPLHPALVHLHTLDTCAGKRQKTKEIIIGGQEHLLAKFESTFVNIQTCRHLAKSHLHGGVFFPP